MRVILKPATTAAFLPIKPIGRRNRLGQRRLPFQVPNHVSHSGPGLRPVIRTQQGQLDHHNSLKLIKHAPSRVHHIQDGSNSPLLPHPIHQNELLGQSFGLNGPPPAHGLQQKPTKCKHIRARRGLPCSGQLRRQVPQRSHHPGGRGVRTVLVQLG
ncbi:LOW QUALITY PROTEIN: hypothetical protein PanWU01x14_256080 [Parasponia andersonii]|uniref:Uncharacterized protein n=1 Tax=Parasponia andersonii TaxID=3476 RepID=A0A2P5BAL9_PARAD|nr:LOW QUALITY PROTEIN: hypothetical protein PanWU01x14_256080 [Parasponia andersonii]